MHGMKEGITGLPSPDPRDDLQLRLSCFKQLIEPIRESYCAEAAVAHQ